MRVSVHRSTNARWRQCSEAHRRTRLRARLLRGTRDGMNTLGPRAGLERRVMPCGVCSAALHVLQRGAPCQTWEATLALRTVHGTCRGIAVPGAIGARQGALQRRAARRARPRSKVHTLPCQGLACWTIGRYVLLLLSLLLPLLLLSPCILQDAAHQRVVALLLLLLLAMRHRAATLCARHESLPLQLWLLVLRRRLLWMLRLWHVQLHAGQARQRPLWHGA